MLVGVGAKRLRSKLYAERSEAARQSRVFNAMLPLAPSERGLPRKRVEEPAKQETVRLF